MEFHQFTDTHASRCHESDNKVIRIFFILPEATFQIFIIRLTNDPVQKGGVLPSKMPVDNPYVPVIAEAAREVYGDYVMYPCRPSTTPDFL